MNVELLEKAKQFLLAHPEHFDMDKGLGDLETGCGTTACLAGTVCLLALEDPLAAYRDGNPWQVWSQSVLSEEELEKEDNVWRSVKQKAIELLDVSEIQANRLFFVFTWHNDFRARHITAKTPEEKAAIASEYINYFISKYAVESLG